jgi:hypothetical protein
MRQMPGLQVSAKAVYVGGDIFGASVRRVGKFIDSHPRCAGRHTGISRVQMLMEVIDAEADNGDVHTLYAFGAQRASHGSRGAGHRFRLPSCEIGEVIDVPPRDDHAMTEIGARISVRRGQVECNDLGVFPENASR